MLTPITHIHLNKFFYFEETKGPIRITQVYSDYITFYDYVNREYQTEWSNCPSLDIDFIGKYFCRPNMRFNHHIWWYSYKIHFKLKDIYSIKDEVFGKLYTKDSGQDCFLNMDEFFKNFIKVTYELN